MATYDRIEMNTTVVKFICSRSVRVWCLLG